jgi:hypothetical protein
MFLDYPGIFIFISFYTTMLSKLRDNRHDLAMTYDTPEQLVLRQKYLQPQKELRQRWMYTNQVSTPYYILATID